MSSLKFEREDTHSNLVGSCWENCSQVDRSHEKADDEKSCLEMRVGSHPIEVDKRFELVL